MKKEKIIKDNQGFFCVSFGLYGVCDPEFKNAIFESLREKVQYGIERGEYTGYIRIDSGDFVEKCSHGSFVDAVRDGLLEKVGTVISRYINGDLADEAEVVMDGYKFNFKISQYERDSKHNWEIIEAAALSDVPENEKLGRVLELVITEEVSLVDNFSQQQAENSKLDEKSFQKALAVQCKTSELLTGEVWALAENVFAVMTRPRNSEMIWTVIFYFDDRDIKLRDEDSSVQRMMSEVRRFMESGFTVELLSKDSSGHFRVAYFHNDPTGFDPENVIACASNIFVRTDNNEVEWFDFAEPMPFSIFGG